MNSVALIGRLGKAPEIKETNAGKIAKFSIAINRNKEVTDWFDVTAFAKTAEAAARLGKGSEVGVTGRLQVDKWEKDGQKHSRVVVIADRITFIGPKVQLDEDSEAPF
jgi:single-strand DNA-binding protein